MSRKKIGIFGGSFDPVHFGHIWVPLSLQEACSLDHVYFIPAGTNPFKQGRQTESSKDRLKMVELALEGVPYCSILPIELERDGPSYTIDTIKDLFQLGQLKKDDQHFLILGEDQIRSFHLWKEVHELVQIAKPLVAIRKPYTGYEGPCPDKELANVLKDGMHNTPMIDISSTLVRDRLKKGLYCGHMIPQKVLEYIHRNKLYISHE